MDEVIGGIIRIIVAVILIAMFVTAIVGLVKKSPKKKTCIVFLIVPVLLVYTMYFSGSFRKAPFDEQNIAEIIEMAKTPNDKDGSFHGSAENGIVEYTGYIQNGKLYGDEDEFFLDRLVDKLFSRTGTYDGRAYYIDPASSDKGPHWEASCHDGYVGRIAIQLDDEHYIDFSYKISRKIDNLLGFFYAPPLFKHYRLFDSMTDLKYKSVDLSTIS